MIGDKTTPMRCGRTGVGCAVRGPSRGYSLMEAIVVIALMALVAVIALPLARGPASGQALEATAASVSARLRETRLAAITANAPREFIVDARARTFGGPGAARPLELAVGIEVEATAAAANGAAADRVARIVFHPDGSSTGGRIVLRPTRRASGARAATIDVDWLSGRVSTRVEG